MAREDVNIKVSADVAEAIRMWRAMEQGPQGMANELDALGKKGKNAARGMEQDFGALVGKWASVGGAIQGARMMLEGMIKAQEQYNRMVKEASVPFDTLKRQFIVQSGVSNRQGEQMSQQILQTAQDRSVTPETAFGAATQMVSSGFSAEQVTGGGLNEFLKLLNATNATGRDVDPAELAKSMTLFLESTGQGKTVANQGALGQEIQGLFKSTNVQTADLALFAKDAGKINQFFPELKNKQLALLSQFEGATDVAGAGTAMRAALSSIRTAGGTPEKLAALKSLGIDFSQVDNESFLEVQDIMTKAFQRTDPTTGNIAAKKLLGDEGMLAKGILFTPEGQQLTRERMAMSADSASYERDVAITEGSIEGQAREAKTRNTRAFADSKYVDFDTVRTNLMTEMQNQGYSRFSQSMTGGVYDILSSVPGATPESALRGATSGYGDTAQRVLQQSKPSMPGDIPRIQVDVNLRDENGVAIPSKTFAHPLNRAK